MKQVNLKNLCMILLGNTVYALAIVMFILPNDMITGGTTGLGIAIHHYFGLPIHTFVLIFNTLMFLLGAAVLGMKFALTTLVSTFYYPVILGVLEQIPAKKLLMIKLMRLWLARLMPMASAAISSSRMALKAWP